MRTYKDIEVKYYDTKGDVHVRCSVPVTEDALVHFELMQSHYCKLSFKLGSAVYFKMGDFIVTDYGRFELVDNVKPKDDGTLGYSYELEFDAYYRKWKNKRLKYMPNSGSPEGTFTLTSNIFTHTNVIKDNLDFLAKASKSYLYDPNYDGEGTDFTFAVDASVDKTKAKAITYSNSSILDAIANIAQTFECEWWVEGNIVHFGTCENTNEVVDFKEGENIVSMSSSQSQASYANRVYAFGAARNLPSGYKQNSSADVTKNGVVEKRLMLPTLEECSAENKKLVEDNGFELKNGCLQVKGLTEDEYVEGVTTNDDIYPRNLIKTSNVTYYEKEVEDESTPEEGDYIKRTFYRVKGLTIVDADGNKTGDMAFRSSYILSGKTLHIIFQSGSLNGMDFECQFNPDGESEILRDENGSPIQKDGKEQINPAAQVFEIVANDDYGRILPDTVLHPKDGDTFVLYNWDSTKLGDTLVTSSANELLTDAIKNLKKSMIDPTTYTCTAASDYSYRDGKGQFHFEGDRVNLFNKGYDTSFRASRIIGYELHLDVPFDSVKYTVGEKPAYSMLNAMSSQIEELVFNGQSYLNKGGRGSSIYIIKSYDTTVPPTDFNVYSAKRVENSYLHKDKADTASFLIKFLRGLQVGDYSTLSGGDWSLDDLFRSHLTTDYLEVRMKAIFEELAIKKNSTIGGKEIISPAGGVAAYKVDEVTVTYNDVSQKAYRCYFLAEQDGDEVDNDFVVEDQVRSESFNLNAGKYHKTGNHFFWRMVIGIDEEPIELDGKKYHYIDLSETDCATGSDVPMKGDVLSQCGNRSDPMRQSCLVFSSVDTYSPSISLYHGINSYSFANKEYVEYGVNKQTNKAFFNVYGDMYVGDRPTKDNGYEGSSYVKYDSATKQVVIKGKLSAKSTVDGKELSQYIKENSEKGLTEEQVNNLINNSQVITDLQNQVNGAIETWFYEGVPTLTNAPAIDWKTDKDKDTHLGDLYYDNKTGKAYRFAKDGSTYKWTIITDTDIAKALSDASKAQETADGKMKVFATQPTPPYQLGDIWVNATYPSDGSTYKNEVLRCQTNKKAGSQFAIADWIKASKYTDDTVANAAKKAAEEAQKAAQTAQTDITNLGKTVTTNKKAFDSYVTDGYLEPSEIAAMAQDSKRLEDDFAAAEKSYNEVKGAEVLKSTKELTDLNAAFTTLTTAKMELITDLSGISAKYNATDSDGKKAIYSRVATLYDNFQTAYDTFYNKLGLASAYITSTIIGKLNAVIGDVASYNYLKGALSENASTDINGGLILSSLIALRDPDTGYVESGINGVVDNKAKGNGIATWWGGYMNDGQVVGFDKKNDVTKQAATSLIRFDGSGYLANGAIYWSVDGKVHADPTSFIISEKNLGAYLTFFEPTWKSGSAGTSVADLVSLKPNAPFTKLGVSGDATFEGAISFHGIKLTYDATNKAIKVDGNLYATGGITAYGASDGASGGGGLNASVISYARIIEGSYTDEDLTSIPNAYAIKALSSRIDNIATELGGLNLSWNNITGKPSTFTPSAHTHKWTEITDRITKVSQLTNDKGYLTSHQSLASYLTRTDAASLYQPKGNYLTAHQSLDDYVNAITTSGSGNAITSVSKSGKTITFTKGSTFLTSHQSLANYVTINDSRLSDSRYPKFANNTWYLVGDDVYIGDHNVNGIFCIKSANNDSEVGISLYSKDESDNASIWYNNSVKRIYTDKEFAIRNHRLWIQGLGSAGGNNNRLTLVAGMPSGLAYNTSCRGTILYSNGIAFADPYNGNSNNDSGWIRHLETTPNAGTLEIAVGDDASNEEIHFRWYNTNPSAETIVHDITVPRATGTLALTSQIPTSLKSPNSLSWSGYNTGSYDGSSPKSFVIPSNNNQLTNGAGYDTVTSVNKKLGNYLPLSGGTVSGVLNIKKTGVQINSALAVGDTDHKNINNSIIDKYGTMLQIIGTGVKDKGAVIGFHNPNLYSAILGFVKSDNETGFIFNTDVDTDSWYVKARAFKGILIGDADSVDGVHMRWSHNTTDTWIPVLSNHNLDYILKSELVGQYNSASATKLQTARTIWGQAFDGTGNVDGLITLTSSENDGGIHVHDNRDAPGFAAIRFFKKSSDIAAIHWFHNNFSGYTWNDNCINIDPYRGGHVTIGNWENPDILVTRDGNVGIKDNSPAYKLSVAGDIYSSDRVIANNSVLSNKLYSSTTPDTNTPNKCIEIAGNTISEYHSVANSSPYHSAIRLYDTSISLSAYGDIDISGYQGSINLRSNGGFAITFRNAKFSVDQTAGAEYTWTMDSIKANGHILATGGITAYSSSDIRLKQDLRKLDYLGIIRAMGGTFSFAWKKDNTRSIGWIAQHVLQNPHLKDIVETDENGYYKINYWSPKLIATAFGAIEQVDDEVTRLKKKVKTLENRVKELEIK